MRLLLPLVVLTFLTVAFQSAGETPPPMQDGGRTPPPVGFIAEHPLVSHLEDSFGFLPTYQLPGETPLEWLSRHLALVEATGAYDGGDDEITTKWSDEACGINVVRQVGESPESYQIRHFWKIVIEAGVCPPE